VGYGNDKHVKQSLFRAIASPEGSKRWRLPDFYINGT
jgi:hypothetical protein